MNFIEENYEKEIRTNFLQGLEKIFYANLSSNLVLEQYSESLSSKLSELKENELTIQTEKTQKHLDEAGKYLSDELVKYSSGFNSLQHDVFKKQIANASRNYVLGLRTDTSEEESIAVYEKYKKTIDGKLNFLSSKTKKHEAFHAMTNIVFCQQLLKLNLKKILLNKKIDNRKELKNFNQNVLNGLIGTVLEFLSSETFKKVNSIKKHDDEYSEFNKIKNELEKQGFPFRIEISKIKSETNVFFYNIRICRRGQNGYYTNIIDLDAQKYGDTHILRNMNYVMGIQKEKYQNSWSDLNHSVLSKMTDVFLETVFMFDDYKNEIEEMFNKKRKEDLKIIEEQVLSLV